jgi:F-type H+-transporting ATPase subunit a
VIAPLLLALALQQAPEPGATPEPHATVQVATSETSAEPAPAGEAAHAPATAAHATPGEDAAGAEHAGPAGHLMHHIVDERYGDLSVGGLNLGPTKHLAFFVFAASVVLLWIRLAVRNYKGQLPGKLASAVEAFVVFVRDDIAEKNIGHDGQKFVPLLLSFFFFILTAALLGLIPIPVFADGRFALVSATSTANIAVTLGLAFISFLAQQYAGISKYGLVHHFAGMVPPGLPKFLLPIMIPVEILAMFTKPFALMVRLFANMLAGHMVITTLLLLIPLMAGINAAFGIFMIPVSLGLALFIMLLELLVALIQAYIFTLLTAIFIGMYAHPAH